MWNDDNEKANLDLDLQKVDHFAHLALWGAPWQKAWLEIAMLEKRWDGSTIGKMVDERIAYPDYAAKVTTPYPQPGWISNLLQTTKPDSMASQFLAMLISNMADGVSQDMKLVSDNSQEKKDFSKEVIEEGRQAELIYREAIEAFTNYTPADLDTSAASLYQSTISLSVQTLKMALSAHLMVRGRAAEAEISFPGISKFADPDQSKEAISGLVEKAVSSMMNNIEMAQLQLPEANDNPDDQDYPGLETERDDNPKHLIWMGSQEYLLKQNTQAALEKWQSAMNIIGNFLDDASQVDQEKLADCAAIFNQTPYHLPLIMAVSQTGWHLLDINHFDLAYRYLLLDQILKARYDKYHIRGLGFSKAVGDMLEHRMMGRALFGLNKFDEAEQQYLAAIAIAQLHSTPQDPTGRKIELVVLSQLELLYWLLLTKANRTADADALWLKFNSRETASLAIDKWIAERTRLGDLEPIRIVREKQNRT